MSANRPPLELTSKSRGTLGIGFSLIVWGFCAVPTSFAQGTTGFESEERLAPGADIAASPEWKTSTPGTGRITESVAHAGTQSLEIKASAAAEAFVARKFAAPKDGIVFLDFFLLPPTDPAAEPSYTMDAAGARLAFVRMDAGKGTVLAVPFGKAQAVETGFEFAIDEKDTHAPDWIRVTLREDLKAGTWDLFLDSRLVLVDQPLAKDGAPTALSFYPSEAGNAWVDDLAIAHDNPLFADADKDNIPDAVEQANGTNAYYADRDGDPNTNGASNIQDFLAGKPLTLRTQEASSATRRFVYIDSDSGDDSESGELSYRTAGRGPKRSLRGAAAVKGKDVVFFLLPSSKPYVCPDYPKGKAPDVSYVLLGNATLTGE
jgi:hypothetical protein